MKFVKYFLTVNDYQAYKEESTVDFLGYMQDIDKCNCDAIEVPEPFELCNTVKVTITTTEPNQNVVIGDVAAEGYYEVGTVTVADKVGETIWVTNGCQTVGFTETERDGEYSYYEATGGGETLFFKTVDVNNAQVGDTLAFYAVDCIDGLPLGFSEITIDGVSLNLSEYEGYNSPHWDGNALAYFYTFANVGAHELVYTLRDKEIKMYSFYELGYAFDDDNWEALEITVEIGNCVTAIKVGAFNNTTLTNITIPSSVTSIERRSLHDDGEGILQSITFKHAKCPFADSDACYDFLSDGFSWNEDLTIYHVCNNSWDTFDSVYEEICEDEGQTICQIECVETCYRAEEQSDGTYKFYSTESGEELENRLVESTETEKRNVDGQWYECTKSYYDVKCDKEWVETNYYQLSNCQECDPSIILKTVMQPQNNNLLIYCDNTGNYINLSEWEIYINRNKIDNSTISKLNRSTDAYYYVYHNDDLDNTQDYTIEYVNNSINTIFEHMFYNDYYSTLKSVEIGDGITTIDNYAFSYCQSLSSLTIASSVTSIGYCTFAYCPNLTSITIPNGITSIGFNAFFDCSRLTNINFNGTLAELRAKPGCGIESTEEEGQLVHCIDGDIYWEFLPLPV